MSRISTRLREFVSDTSVSDHYGAWGALRPDQRRQIRELCDVCDMFEEVADRAFGSVEKVKADAIKEFAERLKNKLVATTKTIAGDYVFKISGDFIDNLVKEMVGDNNG